MKKKLFGLSLLLIVVLTFGTIVCAEEGTQILANTALQTAADTVLYEKADNTSKSLATLTAGTPVVVCEDAQNGWCQVSYKESKGYVETKNLKAIGDKEGLSAEFEQIKTQVSLMFDGIVVYEQEKKRSRIWGAIVIILVVAIFGVGIFSTIKGNKGKKKTEGE